jgi:hypothetical protein
MGAGLVRPFSVWEDEESRTIGSMRKSRFSKKAKSKREELFEKIGWVKPLD